MFKTKSYTFSLFLLLILSLMSLQAGAVQGQNQQDRDQYSNGNDTTDSDNTKINRRDREPSELTADQADQDQSDREIMQKIRKAVIADKSLSSYGRNVKIISQSGKVTLKGPVRSDEERQSILTKAAAVVGEGNIVNELSVKNRQNP